MVGDRELGVAVAARDADRDRRLAVTLRIFEEVADHPAQQRRVAAHRHGLAFEAAIRVVRAFLCRERDEVDRLIDVELVGGLEPAGEQNLVDQLVELGDVALELRLASGLDGCELETELNARERGAQLVRRIGEQHPVGAQEALDPGRRVVEALRELRDLVAALDLDPRAQIAGAEELDAPLQPLEPSV